MDRRWSEWTGRQANPVYRSSVDDHGRAGARRDVRRQDVDDHCPSFSAVGTDCRITNMVGSGWHLRRSRYSPYCVRRGPSAVRARANVDREGPVDAGKDGDRVHCCAFDYARASRHSATRRCPCAPLNAAIALSILFLGPEIVRCWRGKTSFTIQHPWVVAFAFGLVHGFGFASALTSAGLPRKELPLALLTFNVGVEMGQVTFVMLIVLLERSFRQLQIRWPRWVEALPGYAVGSIGAFWTIQRTAILLGAIR